MKAVIYARYSSANQKEESIEGQIRVCNEFAQSHGITVIGNYIDRAISGTTDNRAEFQKMIKDSEKGRFELVITYKIDRFARNRYDSAHYKMILKKNGVKVLYAQENIPDTPEGILLESLLEGIAEHFSADLSQKVKRGKKERALKCQTNGAITLLGYRVNESRQYEIDEETAPIVRMVFEQYADGVPLAHTLRELNSHGFTNTTGRPFMRTNLIYMLKSKKYIGVYFCGDVEIEGGMPAIVEKELFDRVQARFSKNKRTPGHNKAIERYLLSGKAYCGECGETLIGDSCKHRNGEKHRYYKCRGRIKKSGCEKETMRKEVLEDLVARLTMDYFSDPKKIAKIAKDCVKVAKEERTANMDVNMYKKQLAEVRKQKGNIINAIAQGIIAGGVQEKLVELEEQEEVLEIEIENQQTALPVLTEEHIIFMLEQMRYDESITEKAYQEMVLDCFIHSVHLFDEKIVLTFNLVDNEGIELDKAVFSLIDDHFTGNGDSGSCSDIDRKALPTHHRRNQSC